MATQLHSSFCQKDLTQLHRMCRGQEEKHAFFGKQKLGIECISASCLPPCQPRVCFGVSIINDQPSSPSFLMCGSTTFTNFRRLAEMLSIICFGLGNAAAFHLEYRDAIAQLNLASLSMSQPVWVLFRIHLSCQRKVCLAIGVLNVKPCVDQLVQRMQVWFYFRRLQTRYQRHAQSRPFCRVAKWYRKECHTCRTSYPRSPHPHKLVGEETRDLVPEDRLR